MTVAKDAYYFSHDSNSRTDPKILALISDYGMEGYGQWWVLVEILREQDGYKIKHDKCTWKALAMQMHSTADAIQKFITDCIEEYELLQQTIDKNGDDFVYSPSLLRRMGRLDEIKEKRTIAANLRWEKQKEKIEIDANALQMQSNSMQSKLTKLTKPTKLTKEKKSIEKKTFAEKVTLSEIEHESLLNKFGESDLAERIERLSLYKLSTGKSYASDYHTILNWARKDGNAQTKTDPPNPQKPKRNVLKETGFTVG